MGIGEILGLIFFGAVIGVLARLVPPGQAEHQPDHHRHPRRPRRPHRLLAVAACSATATPRGIDWIRWFISIAAAAILVVIYGSITGKKQV